MKPSFPDFSLNCQGLPENRVGETGLIPVSSSRTTVRTVLYTAVPCVDTRRRIGVVFSYPSEKIITGQ
jgi:hypothetical protein